MLTSREHTVQSALQGYTRPHANHTRDSHMGTKLRAWTLMRRKHFQHGSDSFQWFSQKILLVYKSQYVQFKSRGSASLRLEPGQRDRGVWASPIHAPRPAQCPGGAGQREAAGRCAVWKPLAWRCPVVPGPLCPWPVGDLDRGLEQERSPHLRHPRSTQGSCGDEKKCT